VGLRRAIIAVALATLGSHALLRAELANVVQDDRVMLLVNQILASGAGGTTKSALLTDAINWALAQNTNKSSQYFHKLDPEKIAVAGMSCGGGTARAGIIAASASPKTAASSLFIFVPPKWVRGAFEPTRSRAEHNQEAICGPRRS